MKTTTFLAGLLGALALAAPFSCGGETIGGYTHSTNTGGFDPGTTNPNGSGSGAHTNQGGANTGTTSTTTSGPPQCDDSLKRCAHIFTYADQGETSVEVRGDWAAPDSWTGGGAMTKSGSTWTATVDIPYGKDVQYKFVLNGSNWVLDPANSQVFTEPSGNQNSLLSATTCDPWTCAQPSGIEEWQQAVMYFVFVDRFANGNKNNDGAAVSSVETAANYQGGDWAGVTQKIQSGYFTDLGVNALWLTVPMENPEVSGKGTDPGDNHLYSAYHGYWPSDLTATEERFGSMADLKALVDAAHAAKIKIILDYAMNHVHKNAAIYAQHPDWFWPVDLNGQSCICGSSACSWEGPNAKRCWFTDYLPDWNYTIPEARKYSVDNVIWWLQQTGADGLRLDAVKHIETSWLTDLRARVKTDIEPVTKGHVYMVGETFTGDVGLINSYVNPSTMLDGQFEFPLRVEIVDKVLLRHGSMQDLENKVKADEAAFAGGLMSTFVGNHDVPRSIHFAQDNPLWSDPWAGGKDKNWSGQPGLPGGNSAFERLATAFAVILTNKGIPLIYYGDEIGLPGAGDPDNRRQMQWTGYSSGQAFLLDKVKKLTAARKAHEALWRGSRTTLSIANDTWAYKMQAGSDVVYVALNRGDNAQQVGGLPSGTLTDALGGGTFSGPSINVPARTALVLTQ